MKTGGPAFPMQFLGIDKGQLSYEDTDNQEGMSLRDYFAGQAAAFWARANIGGWCGNIEPEVLGGIAKTCYALADALLAEREKHP